MAINFPPQTIGGAKPLDGTIWAAPNGQQWQYDAAIDAWRALGTPSGSGVTYRGPIDLTQDPAAQYANIVAGDFFVVEVGDNPVQAFYPGIAGDEVLKGMEVIFDGTQYAAIGNLVPYASTTVAGKIEIATLAEVEEGTSFSLAVTPITLNQYLDGEYQPQLPSGTDGLFLGHEGGSPKWKLLPKATEQQEGIVELAERAEVPNWLNFYNYYQSGGNYPNPATGVDAEGNYTFSPSLAVTPFSIARFFDDLAFADHSIVQRLESHFGIGGLPTDENGDLITHPIVTDDLEGFMSPAQKQQLEQNTSDISALENRIPEPLTPGAIVAACSFDAQDGVGVIINDSYLNCTVNRENKGRYRLTFDQALPDNHYAAVVCGSFSQIGGVDELESTGCLLTLKGTNDEFYDGNVNCTVVKTT